MVISSLRHYGVMWFAGVMRYIIFRYYILVCFHKATMMPVEKKYKIKKNRKKLNVARKNKLMERSGQKRYRIWPVREQKVPDLAYPRKRGTGPHRFARQV